MSNDDYKLPASFGMYELTDLLGRGGMARVYRAELNGPQGFQKPVAIKLIDDAEDAGESFTNALTNEARLGAKLRHPNVVETYDFGQIDNQWFIAMELVEGWTLEEILQQLQKRSTLLPASVVLEILLRTCDGLTYLHELCDRDGTPLNAVHRDLKPANIMITTRGDVKLMDFGIAKSKASMFVTQAEGMTKGTPQYMSPEQVEGRSLDGRSDQFALGSILYEMLAGRILFNGDTLMTTMGAILNGDYQRELEQLLSAAPLLGAIACNCLENDIEDRYASTREMADALSNLQGQVSGPSLPDWINAFMQDKERGEDETAELPVVRLASACISPLGPPSPEFQEAIPSLGSINIASLQPANSPGPTRVMPAENRVRRRLSVASLFVLFVVLALFLFAGTYRASPDQPRTLIATPTPQEQVVETIVELESLAEKPTEPEPVATPKPRRPKPKVVANGKETTTVTGTATVTFTIKPWANVWLDGTPIGATPVVRHSLPAGEHTVVLTCGGCLPTQTITHRFTVEDGQVYKKNLRF